MCGDARGDRIPRSAASAYRHTARPGPSTVWQDWLSDKDADAATHLPHRLDGKCVGTSVVPDARLASATYGVALPRNTLLRCDVPPPSRHLDDHVAWRSPCSFATSRRWLLGAKCVPRHHRPRPRSHICLDLLDAPRPSNHRAVRGWDRAFWLAAIVAADQVSSPVARIRGNVRRQVRGKLMRAGIDGKIWTAQTHIAVDTDH